MAILNYKRAIACDAGFLEAYNNLVRIIFLHMDLNAISIKLFLIHLACFSVLCLNCLQGNALKDAARVEEAIHCYRVSSFSVKLKCLCT